MALAALGVKPGDEVIVPDLTYVATANAVAYCGATPVFADCEADTWCISAETIEPLITSRTVGIIPVHLYGHPCDMDAINVLAAKRGLFVLEDAAEAHGATVRGRPVGSLGTAATFSFYGNKIITTGEGGMVTTNDDTLAAKMRQLRGQGMDTKKRFWFPMIGFNYRMTNLQAAIGLGQLERLDEKVDKHRQVAAWYREELASIPGLQLPVEKEWAKNVYWLFSVVLEGADEARRDAVMQALERERIETRPFFYPMHVLPMYLGLKAECPVTAMLAAGGINLPTHEGVGWQDVGRVVNALHEALV